MEIHLESKLSEDDYVYLKFYEIKQKKLYKTMLRFVQVWLSSIVFALSILSISLFFYTLAEMDTDWLYAIVGVILLALGLFFISVPSRYVRKLEKEFRMEYQNIKSSQGIPQNSITFDNNTATYTSSPYSNGTIKTGDIEYLTFTDDHIYYNLDNINFISLNKKDIVGISLIINELINVYRPQILEFYPVGSITFLNLKRN